MLKRPILIILLGYILGIILGLYCKISIAFFIVIILFIYIMLKDILLKNKKIKHYYNIFCIKNAAIILVVSIFISNTITIVSNNKYETKYNNIEKANFIAIIVSNPKTKNYYTQYKIKVETINESKDYKDTYLYLNLGGNINIKYGSKISFIGEFVQPEIQRNYMGFNYKEYLKSIGIYGIVKANKAEIVGKGNLGILKTLAANTSLKIKSTIKEHIKNEDNSNLLLGILLGDDDELSKNIKEDFQNSSLSHILATSGMHVSFVIMLVSIVLTKLNSPKKMSKIISIVTLVFFIYLTKETPSVQRACIMAILGLIAELLHKKSDIINNISISLLIILIKNPFSIMDVGLILSFVATIGIIFFYSIVSKILNCNNENQVNERKSNILNKINIKIKEIIGVSISAQILIFPLSIIFFNKVSLTFLLSNLLISALIGAIIILGFILLIIPIDFLFVILNKLLEMLTKIANIFSSIWLSSITVITPNISIILIYYISIFIITYIFILRKKKQKRGLEKYILTIVDKFKTAIYSKRKILFIIGIMFVISLICIRIIPKNLEIHFIDVGQGDSCLVLTPMHRTILIDGGGSKNNEEFDVGKNTLLPYLLDMQISCIDYMIISHFDADHCNGLVAVLENIKVKKLIISKQIKKSSEFENIMKIVKEKNVEVLVVVEGSQINIEKHVSIEILYPQSNLPYLDLNNNSVVLKLVYLEFSMLFTGDIEQEAENSLISKYRNTKKLQATVLKVAHHGSKTSSTHKFIEKVQPKIALIGVGKNNKFGHPNKDVLNRLEQFNSKVYRTDLNGEITLKVDKKRKNKDKNKH